MPPRFFVDLVLTPGAALALPPGPARHVQVLRLQPGSPLTLFDGRGGEWPASVTTMGRHEVEVRLGERVAADRELRVAVTLALGMPSNERMDGVIEKATELGAAVIQPLLCERSVLRLAGDRADKRVAHWQAVALAACEQCGRTRLPQIRPVASLRDWLPSGAAGAAGASTARWVLSLRGDAVPVAARAVAPGAAVVCLSGPEGGLTEAEEDAARRCGYTAVSLGPRVLRADTAPLAVLTYLALVPSTD